MAIRKKVKSVFSKVKGVVKNTVKKVSGALGASVNSALNPKPSASEQVSSALGTVNKSSTLSSAPTVSTALAGINKNTPLSTPRPPGAKAPTTTPRASSDARSSNFSGNPSGFIGPVQLSATIGSTGLDSSTPNLAAQMPQSNFVDASGASALAAINAGKQPKVDAEGNTIEYGEDGSPLPTKDKKTDDQWWKDFIKEEKRNEPVSREDIYRDQEEASGVQEARQKVNNYQSQLDAITAGAEAAKISLIGQGRGIPTDIIGGQQAQIDREAAIKALPIAAQLAAAQSNLELAEDHLNTWYTILSQDAQNKYEHKNKINKLVFDYATAKEKRRLEEIQRDEDRKYNEDEDTRKIKLNMLLSATSQGAPAAIRNAILSAETSEEAIAAAGRYGKDIEKESSSGTFKSGVLSISASGIAEDQQELENTRGEDGYVDPSKYLELYNLWVANKGLTQDFLAKFPPKNYVNPANDWLPPHLRNPKKDDEDDFDSL